MKLKELSELWTGESPSTSDLRFTQRDGNKQQVRFSFEHFLEICLEFVLNLDGNLASVA